MMSCGAYAGERQMTNDRFEEQLQRILARLDTLSESQQALVRPMVEETRRRHVQIREAIARAHTALDDWRLVEKYRIFDAEARWREARALRARRDGNDNR
jgi:hypothetical protein